MIVKRLLSILLVLIMLLSLAPVTLASGEAEPAPEEIGEEALPAEEDAIEKPAEEPIAESVEEPDGEPIEEPVEEPDEEPIEESSEEPAEEAPAADGGDSGATGDLTWTYNKSKLTISGTGDMPSYGTSNTPWRNYRDEIKTVVVGSGVTSVGDYAFYKCPNLNSVSLPAGLKSIGYSAFDSCSALKSITLPSGLESIGTAAFGECTSLESVWIPASVTNVAAQAFWKCPALRSVEVDPANTSYKSEDGVLFGRSGWLKIYPPARAAESYMVPSFVKWIDEWAFCNCANLKSVTLSEGVCYVQKDAFSGCTSLESVKLPSTLASLQDGAFGGCESLKSITIPQGVTTIGIYVFESCNSLARIDVDASNSKYRSVNGVLCTKDGKTLISYPAALGGGNATVPSGVTSIEDYAFYGNTVMKSISFPSSLTSIGERAFDVCSSLVSVTIPDSVTSIGKSAFSDCTSLVSASISYRVTDIEPFTFFYCTSLKSVMIPDGVTSIGEDAFGHCETLENVTLPNSVLSIGKAAFESCYALKSIALSSKLTTIEDNAFHFCIKLNDLRIPSGVESIGRGAFERCFALDNITFTGSAPAFGGYELLWPEEQTYYYPAGNKTWTDAAKKRFGSRVTWVGLTVIDSAAITGLDEPTAGKTGDTAVNVPGGAPYSVERIRWWDYAVSSVQPLSGSWTFQGGHSYDCVMLLTPKSGYMFTEKTTATVNGGAAYRVRLESDGSLMVAFTRSVTGTISSVTLTGFDEAAVGQTGDTTVTVPGGADYTVESVIWWDFDVSDTEPLSGSWTFQTEHAYDCGISLRAKDGYLFTADTAVTLNGSEPAYKDVRENGQRLMVAYRKSFKTNVYTVTFVTDYGAPPPNQYVPKAQLGQHMVQAQAKKPDTDPVDPTGEHVFLYWATRMGMSMGLYTKWYYTEYDFDKVVSSDLTLYAVWEDKPAAPDVLLGDVNGDGNVNPADRAALARYLAKWPDYQDINLTNADVNADGKVNPADRAYLARHFAKWPAYATLGVPV